MNFRIPSHERNMPCPCGSGRKFKQCFGRNDPSCSLFKEMNRKDYIQSHTSREKEVFDFFKGVMEESNQLFLDGEDGVNRTPLRLQMIVAFSVIDVLASYWFQYLNQTGKTNDRAQAWYDEFCKTETNPNYTGLLKELTSDRLYNFRNALVHFFGLGEDNYDVYIALAANDLTDDQKEKMETAFLMKKHKTIMLRPKDFFNLIREGALLMLENWQKTIKDAQTNPQREKEYIEGIERVYSKIMKEGAKGISRDKVGLHKQ